MTENFRATTQYNDFFGEVAIDGHSGPFQLDLAKRANMPSGYWPVGFSIYTLEVDENDMLPMELIAVRIDEHDIDTNQNIPDQLFKLAEEVEELNVYPISFKMPLDELNSLMKRLSIKACLRQIPQEKLRVDYDNRP